jgi:tetratricopeptide (TPR) repeat protein
MLRRLSEIWGASHSDLAPYYYNFALSLKACGRQRDSLTVLGNALAHWPDDLQCRVLDTTTRAEIALAGHSFSDAAHAGFETILRAELVPRLRGMRVPPAQLFGLWGEMLVRVGRLEEALDRARRGLEDEPAHLACLATMGRALVRLHRDSEALPVLESVVKERSTPELSLYLALAYSRTGDAPSAWLKFETLLSADLESWAGSKRTELRRLLLQEAGRTLNELGRHRESGELLLELLQESPDNATALFQLSRSARALGSSQAADAIDLRIRQLAPREHHIKSATSAAASGFPASVAYYQARASISVDRPGESLRLLDAAETRSPGAVEIHLERARVHALLGRVDHAEWATRRAAKNFDSPILRAEHARLLAKLGDVGKASSVLAELESLRADPESGPTAKGLATRCATAHLHLADLEGARRWLVSATVDEESLLCRAGIAVADGRLDEADKILSSSFNELPGGESRANALRLLLDVRKSRAAKPAGVPKLDPSDAIDHAYLFRHALFLGRERAPGTEAGTLAEILDRRDKIVRSMRGLADRDVVSRFEELHAFYAEVHARRKAREIASYLVHLDPSSKASLRMARTFSDPEHILVRLSAIQNALRVSPDDSEARLLLKQERELLGLKASPSDR